MVDWLPVIDLNYLKALPTALTILVMAFITLVVGYVIISFIIDLFKGLGKNVIKRISKTFSLLDILLVFIVYYLMLSYILSSYVPWLRIILYITITVTALYVCAEKPK
jgi:ABC-type tungstate transport system substrate-binding protein